MATDQVSFRKYLPDLNTPRFQTAKEQTPYEYTNTFFETRHPPWLHNLTETWKELLKEPFTGVTNDGMNCHSSWKRAYTDLSQAASNPDYLSCMIAMFKSKKLFELPSMFSISLLMNKGTKCSMI